MVWISLLATLAACAAAVFAFRATYIAERTAKTNLALEIRNTYSSQEMYDSMTAIKGFFETYRDDPIAFFLNRKRFCTDEFKGINGHRRRFVHLYHNIRILNKAGLLDEDIIKKIVMPEEVQFLIQYVEPLDKALPDSSSVTFDFFRDLFPGIKRSHAEQQAPQEEARNA